MSELAKAWLSLFGNSAVFLLPEGSAKIGKGGINYNNYFGVDKSIEINKSQSYGLFFTPNGNLGRVNSEGENVKRKQSDCEDYICCFYADLDKKDSKFKDKSMDEYFDYIKEVIQKRDFLVQFIVQSGGGFHLYSFVDKSQCVEMGQRFKSEFKFVQNCIADIFDGGDHSSHSINKLMRMPFSLHRKTATPKQCKLYRVDKPEDKYVFTEVTKPEQINLEGKNLTKVNGMAQFIDNQRAIVITNNKGQDITFSPMTEEINKLPIVDVLRKLENYPRRNDKRQNIKFLTDGERIWFNIDGQIVYTDGYKINKEKNYVHNFSTSLHPKDERPRGPVYNFLLNYFNKDMTAMGTFLKQEYNIDFIEGGKETFLQLPTDNGIIMFQDDGVYYRTTKTRGKETEDANEKLFNVPFIVKGGMKIGRDNYGEIDDVNYRYIISLLNRDEDDPEEMIIDFEANKASFNNHYGSKGITFTKSDTYLLDFYSALNAGLKSGRVRKYECINMNGYYPDMYIEGDRIYNPTGDLLEDTSGLSIQFKTPKIDTMPITTEVSMKEYGQKLREVFVDEESILCYVTFLALVMGDKFWNTYLNGNGQQIIIPGLFISGKTKSGKSTMVNLLLNGFGLSSNCRRASVKGTTPQPLKQSATDDFILHREEFTGRGMTEEKENLIRDVLNKTRTARGMIDGSNARYTYRSSLILDGERLPDSESVINRCVVVPFNIKGRIGTMEQLRAFNGVGFKRDFIEQLYKVKVDNIEKDFREAQDKCLNAGILDRYSMLYGFVICVNKWFQLFDEDELLNVIKKNLKESDELDKEQTPLASILNEVINEYKVKPTLSDEGDTYKVIIPIPKQLISQVKLDIMDMIKYYGANRMIFSKQNLVITLSSSDSNPLNMELYDTIILYKAHFHSERFLDLDGFISD